MANPGTALLPAFLVLAAAWLPAQADDPTSLFEIEVEHARLPSVSQGVTGTCWSFATTSFLESELQRIHGAPVDLSEMHTVFHTYLEKARRYVRLHGKTQFDEGGLCHDVLFVIDRFGVAPQKSYTGLCGRDTRHDHAEMVAVLKAMVEKVATSQSPSDRWEAALRGVLEGYLGRLPDDVQVDGKTLTPREYARALKLDASAYRQVTSLAGQPFWRKVELLVPDNWMRHQDYWNVPVAAMLDALDAALRKGYTAAIDIDITEPGTRRSRTRPQDVWVLPDEQEKPGAITDAVRQGMFDDRSTTDDHLMHVVGIARHRDGRAFYLTKDSYGVRGPFKGHRMISRSYLMAKMLSFMVHKDALPSEVAGRFE